MALIDGEYYYRPPAKKTVAKKVLAKPVPAKQEYYTRPPNSESTKRATPPVQSNWKPMQIPDAPPPKKEPVGYYAKYIDYRTAQPSPARKWAADTNYGFSLPGENNPAPKWVNSVGNYFLNTAPKAITDTRTGLARWYEDAKNTVRGWGEYDRPRPFWAPTLVPKLIEGYKQSAEEAKTLKPNASQYKSFYEQQTNKYGTFGWVPPYTSNEMAQRYNPQWANSDQGNALRYLTDQLGLNIPLSAMGAPNSAGGMGAPYYDPIVPPYNSTTRTVPGNQTRLPNSPAATYPTQRPVSTQANVTRLPGSPASPWASSLYNVTRLPGTSATNAVQTKTPYQLPQWHPYQYRGEFDPYEMGGSPYQITDPFNFAPMTMDELLASGADPWAHDPYDPAGSPYMTSNLESTAGWDGSSGGGYGWGGWGDGGWGGGGGGGSYGASSGVSSYLPGAGGGYGARASAPNYTGRGAGRGSSYAGSESYNTPQWRMPMLVWNI
jgi:hypothetical protein